MPGASVDSAYTKHNHESKCSPEIRIDSIAIAEAAAA